MRSTPTPSRFSHIRYLSALLLSAGVLPGLLLAQGLTPQQVEDLRQVTSVALSPAGQRVAYTVYRQRGATDPVGRAYSELWVVAASGGSARAIVSAPSSASSPQWSPDGTTLAFTAQFDDMHRQTQVYGVPAGGGQPRMLTSSPIGVMGFAFSPDGRSVAYTAREPVPDNVAARQAEGDDEWVAGEGWRHVRLWVESIATHQRRPVTPEHRTVWSFAWAPDGQRFAVQTTESPEIDYSYMFRELATVSLTGGPMQRVTETPGKLGGMAWSPDGTMLAFIGAVSQNDPIAQSLFVVPGRGGTAVNRTRDYQGSVLSVQWVDDDTMLFLADEGTKTALNRIAVVEGSIERVAGGGAEIFGDISFDARFRTLAVSASTARHPSEVFLGPVRGGALERLTNHNPWLDRVELATQEAIEWHHPDGTAVEGVLVHPLNRQPGVRYPLAILPHGGPEGTSLDGWTTRPLYPAQVLAAQGYAVLMPNYRGSGGRGVAFSKADHRDLGGKEFEDVIAGIDYLADGGLVDPDRVGSSGTSYGGYFSAWAATRHPDRFAAAISFAGISNWASFTGTTDIPYEMSLVHWDLWWFDNPGLAWDRSPVAHVNDQTSPLLIGHGGSDERVHPEQSLELYQALRINQIPTGLVIYPREPHGLRERAHELDFMGRIIEWFDRYVKAAVPATM